MGSIEQEKEYLYWLCRSLPAFAVTIRQIQETYGSFQQAYYIEGMELLRRGIIKNRKTAEIFEQAKHSLDAAREEYSGLDRQGIRFVTPLDPEYPERLRHIYDYPMGLWIKGSLPPAEKPTVAVIGARSCTVYGEQAAGIMGRELAAAGVAVISGLALGVDGAGHRGALSGGGEIWGVLGCGVNICYPKQNYPLFREMEKQGGLISEYPPGEPPRPQNFPVRNRIISGLADAVLVIEANEKSGSLITAQLGLEQGKEIFALPGRVTDSASRGCNQLIQAGAALLTGPGDVLEFLGILHEKKLILREKSVKGLAKNEKMVYSCLDSAPKHVEEIAVLSGMCVGECMSALLDLELGGLVVKTAGQSYARRVSCD